MKKSLAVLFLVLPILYGFPAEKFGNSGTAETIKKSESPPVQQTAAETTESFKKQETIGSPTNYAVETMENSSADKITESIGKSQEVEVIEGDYSKNETKPRTTRHGHGGGGGHSSGGHSHSSGSSHHSYSGGHSHGGYGGWHHHSYSSYSPSYYSSSYYSSPSYYSSSYTPSYYGSYGYGNNNYYGYGNNNYYGYGNSNYYCYYYNYNCNSYSSSYYYGK